MAKILDGRALSEKIKKEVREDVEKLRERGIEVGLGLMLVGENPASLSYFEATTRATKKLGIRAFEFRFPGNVSINELLNSVHSINRDERINGLLVLFPLPKHINARRIVNEIAPEKDVDGLGYRSIGRLAADESMLQIFSSGGATPPECRHLPANAGFLPCTPYGVIRLLEHYEIPMKGMHAVIIGKSLAVGKPLSLMFLAKGATVSVCHRDTKDLASITRQADMLCSATGVPGLVKGDMVKEGAVVVDIGIKVLEEGKITGDVEFESVEKRASYVTPVPGGVGPVTIAMLLENTVRSANLNEFLKSPMTME